MTSRFWIVALSLAAAPAWAQTTPTGTAARHVPPKHAAVHKAVVAKPVSKTPAKHVPVVGPRHGATPRHATPSTAAALKHPLVKPAAKKEPAPVAAAKPAAPKKPAPPPPDPSVGTNTGMHLPRYASLKSDDVNMRVGPAERYPVKWTYKRRELPVKIEREFDIWRLVEDMDGIQGWVHQATLTGRRTFVVTGTQDRTLRADASETADAVAVLKPGVVGRIKGCEAGKAWCQVQVQDYRGWLRRGDVWGVDANEVVEP